MLGVSPLELLNNTTSSQESRAQSQCQSPGTVMEEIQYGTDNFEVPSGLTEDFSYLMDVISPETWNNVLTDEHRELLMKFLPDFPQDDLNEKTHTLEMFFMNKNFYFGSPLQKFFLDFKNGFFNPDVAKIRKVHRKILHRSYKYRQKKYFHNLLEDVLIKRKEILDGVRNQTADWEHGAPHQLQHIPKVISKSEACMQRASKRYFKELKSLKAEAGCDSDLSDDDNYSDGFGLSLNKKQRRQLFLLEASFPPHLCLVRSTHTKGSLALDLEAKLTSNKNPFDATEEQFKNLLSIHLANHKKKSCPSLDTRGLTLKSVLERSEMLARRPVQRPPPSPLNPAPPKLLCLPSRKPQKRRLKPSPHVLPSLPLIAPEEIKRELSSDSFSSEGEVLDLPKDVVSSPAAIPTEDIKPSLTAELTQETHLSFFSLLRDIVCSTHNQRMGRHQLTSSILTWQESAISPLNEWFCLSDSWDLILPTSINFLCGNIASDLLPCDFVPFIEYKNALKQYQWIGAGRDSDANLEPLCQYWLSNSDKFSNDWPKEVTVKAEPEDTKSVSQNSLQKLWDVKQEPEVVERPPAKTEYHIQEKNRYEQPHKAFTYRMSGYDSVIGPVKGVYTLQQTGSTTKARGHVLLVPDRPPYVTILSLVWDSVARLPNSEGTKMEICELLKESQFLVPINTPTLETALNVVVSGALDRLQNEKDPCVKFDTGRKLWVYLHKSRSEKELEMMHQLKLRSGSTKSKSQSASRKVTKKKDESAMNQGPPNVTMEQFAPAIKQMDGSEVRIKDEDILKKWEKLATTKGKKKEKTNRTSSLMIKTDSGALKNINLGVVDSSSLSSGSQILPVFTTQTLLQTSPSSTDAKSAVSLSGGESPTLHSAIQIAARGSPTLVGARGSPTLVQATTTAASLSPIISTKPSLQSQTSKKYQSSFERKKLVKAIEGGRSSPSSSRTAIISKAISTQPSTSTTTVTTQHKGIKLLQYSNPNLQAKGLVSNASLVMDTSTAVPTLVGQKLVMAGSRVLVQGGKVLHNMAGAGSRGKQVLAGMLPGQHIMAVNSIKKQSGEHQTVEGGRFIQIATVDAQGGYQKPTGYQKLTLVPQFSQATLATGSGKAQEIQSLGLGKSTLTTAGELKLKLGSTAFATASGNIISLGGKQILLTTKGGGSSRGTQIHQVVVGDSRTRLDVGGSDPLRSGTATQQIIVPASVSNQSVGTTVSSGSQQVVVTTSSGVSQQQRLALSGQQIVVPASALAGSQLNLKRLQAFQSFKVVPASQLAQHQGTQRGKPVVAHILAPSPNTTAGAISSTKLALQIASTTESTQEK